MSPGRQKIDEKGSDIFSINHVAVFTFIYALVIHKYVAYIAVDYFKSLTNAVKNFTSKQIISRYIRVL